MRHRWRRRSPPRVSTGSSRNCRPVLLADRDSRVVAAAHAGWRGLAAGVIEAAVAELSIDSASVLAWLGPAIGPCVFEVGSEVVAAFCDPDPGAAECFVPSTKMSMNMSADMKWHADLYALA